MISFRTKSESATSVAIIAALLILVGTGLFMILVKPPTTDGTAAGKIRAQAELEDRLEKLKADNIMFKTAILDHTWPQKTEEIGPTALASITAFAQKHRLKLMASATFQSRRGWQSTCLPVKLMRVTGSVEACVTMI